jgi:serine/threonine protein kinase
VTLSNDRIVARGVSAHPHEREAVDFAIRVLPDRDPLRLWALVDLVDQSGRRYDLDLVVIGYHAVYLVEIKSHPGKIAGDLVDWHVTFPDGGRTSFENPLRLTTHKARVLGSLLDKTFGHGRPFVQPLVFLSAPDVEIKLDTAAMQHVVTRATFERAMTFGEFPGVPPRLQAQTINRPTAQRTSDALQKLGLKESVASRKVGNLLLADLILERQNYQDHLAYNERLEGDRSRVRTYQVAPGSGEERRQVVARAAEREARMLSVLSDHPNILRLKSYVPDGPRGAPCVVFEDFKDGLPLDGFLRANKDLSLDERVQLLQQLADALAYCHRKRVLHRGLAPSSVLVRRHPETNKLDVRLFNFQLSMALEATTAGTLHFGGWFAANEDVYVAPEVIEKPSKASEASDVFSLGALAFLVLTGRPPGENLVERASLMLPGYLSLATAQDSFASGVLPAELLPSPDKAHESDLEYAMQLATNKKVPDRENDVTAWIEALIDALTAPQRTPTPDYADPHSARKDDEIAKGVRVKSVLGVGSTARTLRVELAEGGVFALKVALTSAHDERVRREGELLRTLDSDRIVRLYATPEIGGRSCLRMTDAGDTLAKVLLAEGVPNVEFARRWGEDLLLALSHLEERGVQHRDIKPDNLGVNPSDQKKKKHLTLFDFSLSSVDAVDVRAGTPAYRDPFLPARGRWDDAADRYAAAITLHELLTGERPQWGEHDLASATDAPITLAAERFDASSRERLVAFFQRALARKVEQRFSSADDMRTEWLASFSRHKPASAVLESELPPIDSGHAALPDDLSLDTPVAALPLSAAVQSALDRAGVLQVRELLALPNNELSVVRGIGRQAARQILALKQRRELQALAVPSQNVSVTPPSLPPAASPLLPWLEKFLVAAKRSDKGLTYVRVLLGLEPAAGRYVDTVAQAAGALKVTRALLYTALGQRRELWRQVPELSELQRRLSDLADAQLRIAPLDTLADALARDLGAVTADGSEQLDEQSLRQARALCRIALETQDALKSARVHDALWVVPQTLEPKALTQLGELADRLAAADPLLSPGMTEERLREGLSLELGKEHLLTQLPAHRMVALAAQASQRAAKSARLELYPRGMAHTRALELCATALPAAKLSPELLQNVVRARYPDAEPLPVGSALRELMQGHGYQFDAGSQQFERARSALEPGTQVPPKRVTTVHTPHRTRPDPDAYQFAQDIAVREKRGTFCVLEVTPHQAQAAARELGHRLGVAPISVERVLLEHMHGQMRAQDIEDSVVYATDRQGRLGGEWHNLRELMRLSAEQALGALLNSKEPLVLTDPGLLARFGLQDFVKALIERARADDAPATFLIVPVTDEPGGARIQHPDGDLAVPLTSQAQRLRVPEAWLRNLDQQ